MSENQPPAGRIDGKRLTEQDSRIPMPAQHGAQRRGDLTRGKRAGRHLVQQWLKQMKIAPVDQRHFHRRVAQGLRGVQSAETPSQNDYAMHTR